MSKTPSPARTKKRHSFWKWLALSIVIVGIGLMIFLLKPAPLPDVSAAIARLPQGPALIERGKYLATAADCAACHTGPSGLVHAGGRPFPLPFGTLYTPNITSDKTVGIGNYSEAEFVRAVRHGVNARGENLYPAFSYTSYALMTDEDALAIRAYLLSLPAIPYKPPENDMKFPFNQRYGIRLWNLLFLPTEPLKADTSKSEEWNKGAYLVEALAHCGQCHTPRNFAFAMDRSRNLGGSELTGWKFYNITPDKETGVGSWQREALVQYLATGHAEGHGSAGGGMAEAIDFSLRHLPRADIEAIVTYITSLPAVKSDVSPQVQPPPQTLQQSTLYTPVPATGSLGERLFAGACANCHGYNGKGVETPFADLVGARSVNDPQATNLLQAILSGSHMGSSTTLAAMPRFEKMLTDVELAALAEFVVSHFGGVKPTVTVEDAKTARGLAAP